jgi:pimeloyl-ACP methyl ester carboxylesterase
MTQKATSRQEGIASMKETLILIPGFANNQLVWEYQRERLKEFFDVHICIMDPFLSRQEMVEHILKQTPERMFLAGHSMGGWIAQGVAAKAPERIEKLVLLNTWVTSSPQRSLMQKQMIEAFKMGKIAEVMQLNLPLIIHPSRLRDAPLLQIIQSMLASFSIDTLIHQLQAMINDDSSLDLLSSITAPTLIVHSQQDALFPKEHETLLGGIKNSMSKLITNCGHSSLLEKPEETTQAILSFLQQL